MAKLRKNNRLQKKKATINREASRSGHAAATGGYHKADTKRDMWTVGGLPDQVTFDMSWNMFRRSGLGRAVIMRPDASVIKQRGQYRDVLNLPFNYDHNEVRRRTVSR